MNEDAEKYYDELYYRSIRTQKNGWYAAGVALAGWLVTSAALVLLMPLKELVPYPVEINHTTGEVKIGKVVSSGEVTEMEAMRTFWINKYLLAYLSYDIQTMGDDYEHVRLFSSQKVFDGYDAVRNPKAIDSPYLKYGVNGKEIVRVKSITYLGKGVASAEVYTTVRDSLNIYPEVPSIVTLTFEYTLSPESEEERRANPLGFQVIDFRQDAVVVRGRSLN